MRHLLITLSLLLLPLPAAHAELSVGVGISAPGVHIGINLPAYPRLVRVPGHPVYYDPRLDWNYFFFDGLYWVFYDDDWYASVWYNGPWRRVDRYEVPLYVLRVPVRYYRKPPPYFRAWRADAPPRWGERWGREWEDRRSGWDRWDRHAAPRPAPLPYYQRGYKGDRYPGDPDRQDTIRSERYRYQPREPVSQHFYRSERAPAARDGRPGGQPERRDGHDGRDGRDRR